MQYNLFHYVNFSVDTHLYSTYKSLSHGQHCTMHLMISYPVQTQPIDDIYYDSKFVNSIRSSFKLCIVKLKILVTNWWCTLPSDSMSLFPWEQKETLLDWDSAQVECVEPDLALRWVTFDPMSANTFSF